MNKVLSLLISYWYLPLSLFLAVFIYIFYKNFKRITSLKDLPDNFYGKRVTGIVTYVADGDTFRFYHTPIFRSSSMGLGMKTLSIRIAGIDAPEGKYFGGEGQPLHKESQNLLSDLIHLKKVELKLLKTDRYNRVLAIVYIKKCLYKIDIASKMLEHGMACVYTGSDAVYDNKLEKYKEIENTAKKAKKGIWKLKNYESPMAYKKRMRSKNVK